MNEALYIAATGMHMQQKNVDTIANNLANVNTPTFKKGKVSFEDLVYRDLNAANLTTAENSRIWQGSGVALSSISKSFTAGELKSTDQVMDFAISGEGFFEVVSNDASPAYSRGGTFTIDKDGFLANGDGHALKPSIHIGTDINDFKVLPDGRVMVKRRDQANLVVAGRVELVRFADVNGMVALGGNLYKSSEKSGEPIYGRPGEEGLGTIAQGFLESSNVKLIDEMVGLMVAKRAYESSVKVIQAADELLAMSNNLRK